MKTKYDIVKAKEELERINLMYDTANWCAFFAKSQEIYEQANVASVIPEYARGESGDITVIDYSWKESNKLFLDEIIKQESNKWLVQNKDKIQQIKQQTSTKFHEQNRTKDLEDEDKRQLEKTKNSDKQNYTWTKITDGILIFLGIGLLGLSASSIWYYSTQKKTWWILALVLLFIVLGALIGLYGIQRVNKHKVEYKRLAISRHEKYTAEQGAKAAKYEQLIAAKHGDAVIKAMKEDKALQTRITERFNDVLKFETQIDKKVKELKAIKKKLATATEIPHDYCNPNDAPGLFVLLKNKRANTIKELINLYEDHKYKKEVIKLLNDIGKTLVSINNNVMSELRRIEHTVGEIKSLKLQQLAAQNAQIAANRSLSVELNRLNTNINSALVKGVW